MKSLFDVLIRKVWNVEYRNRGIFGKLGVMRTTKFSIGVGLAAVLGLAGCAPARSAPTPTLFLLDATHIPTATFSATGSPAAFSTLPLIYTATPTIEPPPTRPP